jgi:S-adenosylmethionine synthetase
MDLRITSIGEARGDASEVEIVERKGLGHPDTICDALAESFSRALSRAYVERCGAILHHNVDKVLLRGGASEASLGGGRVVEPIEIYLAGRATMAISGEPIPVEEIAERESHAWLRAHLHALDPDRHVRIRSLVRGGSADLVELYMRERESGQWLSNDTSCGVGFAPLSRLEQTVDAVERRLSGLARSEGRVAVGEDVKVMGVRQGDHVQLTIGCALIGPHLPRLDDYLAVKAEVAACALETARERCGGEVSVVVNAADDPDHESLFLTVTGTSAEAGDDGEAGRGNRANGLITPGRPMTLESVAGKNPVTHVGKIYNVVAGLIAEAVVDRVEGVDQAECLLVSRIGHPVADPAIAHVRIGGEGAVDPARRRAEIDVIVRGELARLPALQQSLVEGTLSIDRWPFRVPGARAGAG